jgi:hypothetical protein
MLDVCTAEIPQLQWELTGRRKELAAKYAVLSSGFYERG